GSCMRSAVAECRARERANQLATEDCSRPPNGNDRESHCTAPRHRRDERGDGSVRDYTQYLPGTAGGAATADVRSACRRSTHHRRCCWVCERRRYPGDEFAIASSDHRPGRRGPTCTT